MLSDSLYVRLNLKLAAVAPNFGHTSADSG